MPVNSTFFAVEEESAAPEGQYLSDLFSMRSAFEFHEVSDQEYAKLDTELQIIRAEGVNYRDVNLAALHAKYIDISIHRIVWKLYHENYNEALCTEVKSIISNLRTLLADLELFLYSAPFLRKVRHTLEKSNPIFYELSDQEQTFIAKVRNTSRERIGDLTALRFNDLNKTEKDYICRIKAYNIVHPNLDSTEADFCNVEYLTFGLKQLATKLVVMHSILDYLSGNISVHSVENIKKIIEVNNQNYSPYDSSFAYYELALLKLALLVGVFCNLQQLELDDNDAFKKRMHTLAKVIYGKLNLKFALMQCTETREASEKEVAEYLELANTLLTQAVEHLLDANPGDNLVVKEILFLLRDFAELRDNQRFQDYLVQQIATDLESSGQIVVAATQKISSASTGSQVFLPSMMELPVPVSDATTRGGGRGDSLLTFSPSLSRNNQEQDSSNRNCCLPTSSKVGCSIC